MTLQGWNFVHAGSTWYLTGIMHACCGIEALVPRDRSESISFAKLNF